MKTAKTLRQELEGMGVIGSAGDYIIEEIASQGRQEWRVEQAREAAIAEALRRLPPFSEADKAKDGSVVLGAALLILIADGYGIGGTGGVEGSSTLRHPGLGFLGCKHSRDGVAWDAAIRCAAAQLREQLDLWTPLTIIAADDGETRLISRFGRGGFWFYGPGLEVLARPWAMVIARDALRCAVGLRSWFAPEGHERPRVLDIPISYEGSARAWAKLVNELAPAAVVGATEGGAS